MSVIRAKVTVAPDGVLRVSEADAARLHNTEWELVAQASECEDSSAVRVRLLAEDDGTLRAVAPDELPSRQLEILVQAWDEAGAERRRAALQAYLALPPLSVGEWPEGYTVSRASLYRDEP